MEVLSRYLRTICDKQQVSFHPKCCAINLTHLIFADDLMNFTRGDVASVNAVTDTLKLFAQLSGLTANIDKTCIYFGGVANHIQDLILRCTGFSQGEFPFRHLGLPLNTSRITISMFDPFILKIQKAIQHWTTHSLSYAGGFNVKDLEAWNLSLLCKWPWLLSSSSPSKWAHWTKHYVLKSTDIWSVHCKEYFSSSFKGILAAKNRLVLLTGDPHTAATLLHSWVVGGVNSV
ncbi:uncharacterized protein LOC141614194 [Silene latifolia]|uniref:uncharacterized protein LOC141614194 n=1 Tax=Silene latifolia TaxID=37657 RepID=UPI003D780CB8